MRSAKRDAIAWAKSVIADPTTVFLDTETTGLKDDDDIIDIAIVSVDGTTLFESLVCTNKPVPKEATAVHGITEFDLDYSPWWEHLSSTVLAILYGRRVVVFNAKYDFGYVTREFPDLVREAMLPKWECAMSAYGAYDGTEAGWRGGYKWHKLSAACEHFGIEPGTHRALADAEACRQVVIAMANTGEDADAF